MLAQQSPVRKHDSQVYPRREAATVDVDLLVAEACRDAGLCAFRGATPSDGHAVR
jgi:hypothetical protein